MSQPAAATSTLPPATILIALVVLAVAALVLLVAARRASKTGGSHAAGVARNTTSANLDHAPSAMTQPEGGQPVGQQGTVDFLTALGRAMIDSGDPVTHVQDTLRRIAHANGVSAAGILVMPTALIVSLPGEHELTTSVTVAGDASLRLDQIDAVFAVAEDAAQGQTGAG